LSTTDRKIFEQAQRTIAEVAPIQEFINDMENLKLMADVEGKLIASYRQDLLDYGGDPNAIGSTFGKANYDKRMNAMAGLWVRISEKVPTQEIVEFEQMQKLLNQKRDSP